MAIRETTPIRFAVRRGQSFDSSAMLPDVLPGRDPCSRGRNETSSLAGSPACGRTIAGTTRPTNSPGSFTSAERGNTTSRTSTFGFPAMRSSSSPASRAPASRHWRSAPSTPRHSAAISSRSLRTRAVCSIRWACRMSTRSMGSRLRSRCNSNEDRRRRVRRSGASRRSRTCCGCCIRARATTRTARTSCTRSRSHRTRRRVRVRSVTASAASTMPPSSRWYLTIRCRFSNARSRHGPRHGTARTCATSSPRSATTSIVRGASCRKGTGTGCYLLTSNPPFRCTRVTTRPRSGAR